MSTITEENPLAITKDSSKKKTSSKEKPSDTELGKRLDELKSKIPAIQFTRKNDEQQKNKKLYFFGLLPCLGRGTYDVGGLVTLNVFTGKEHKDRRGKKSMVEYLGQVDEIDDEELEQILKAIKKKGVRFRGRTQSAEKFTISENEPSQHSWRKKEYPLGQYCYFFPVEYLNQKYPGGELQWRSQGIEHETLIPREKDMPGGLSGWEFPEEKIVPHQKTPDGEDLLFGPFGNI